MMTGTQEVEWVVHEPEGHWFDPRLHQVSLGKMLNTKLLLMARL